MSFWKKTKKTASQMTAAEAEKITVSSRIFLAEKANVGEVFFCILEKSSVGKRSLVYSKLDIGQRVRLVQLGFKIEHDWYTGKDIISWGENG